MFAFWGRFVYRHRRPVVGLMTLVLLIAGVFGLGLPAQLSQSGYDDPNSESTRAAILADETFGREHASDIILVFTAPAGLTVDDPAFAEKVSGHLEQVKAEHPDEVGAINSYWSLKSSLLADPTKQHAFASVELTAETDTASLNQFKSLEGSFEIPGVDVEVSGLQAIGDAIGVGMEKDTLRAEIIALPLVAILLFFVFGGIIAASLPVIIGVLTIAGATGAMWALTHVMEVNTFAQPVVTLIGLGVAIDYGLFIVSRFREEIAEGYEIDVAVRRTVMTAGRTVVFSATMLVVSFAGLLMFPQGFLKSVAIGGLAAIALAALCSVTVLPAILGMLGKRVDSWSLPFLRKTKTKEEIESGFWGKLTDWVTKHPALIATPIIVILLLLIVPFKNIAFGGLSETYLPPGNETRVAQEHFDELFPSFRTNPMNLVVTGADAQQVFDIALEANQIEGFTGPFQAKPAVDGVNMLTSGLIDPDRPGNTIDELRAIPAPDGVEILVGGVPAMTQDSISALADRLPMMLIFIVVVTTLLMFLAFGSLVLPIKAVLMSALGLGSTLGILTWIFIDGHGSNFLNFTPGPLMAAVLVLLLAIIFGLSTDYEVFLLSRMIEARENGATTQEAIRAGTAHTGRIITAAALILIVVTGAFGFSEIVMMKYIAYGMIAALILDATVIRMLLVPSVMTLLGDDCWWAPKWMKRIQHKIGLGEVHLPDELPASRAGEPNQVTTVIPRITADLTPAFAAERPVPRPATPATAATSTTAMPTTQRDAADAARRPTVLPAHTDFDERAARTPIATHYPLPPAPPTDPSPRSDTATSGAATSGTAKPETAEEQTTQPRDVESRDLAPQRPTDDQVPRPRRRRATSGDLPSDSAARQFSGRSSWTDRPQPLYPWEDRPSAPARGPLPESDAAPSDGASSDAAPSDDARGPGAATPTEKETTGRRRRRAPEPPATPTTPKPSARPVSGTRSVKPDSSSAQDSAGDSSGETAGDTTAAEPTDSNRRHLDNDNARQVTVDDLLRRSREAREE